jgi:hypothetical protein
VFEIVARGDRVRTALSGRDPQIATGGIRMAMRAAMKSRRHCSPISIAPRRNRAEPRRAISSREQSLV